MNKNIIIAILVIIIIACAGAFIFAQNGKMGTQINFLNSKETFQNGEQVQFELKDSQGKAISGQNIEITYNTKEKYSITTDQNGKGYLTISGENAGKYDIEAKYDGNEKYNGCSAKDAITITDDLADNVGSESGASVATTDQYNDNSNGNGNGNGNGSSGGGNGSDDPDIVPTYVIPHYHIQVETIHSTVVWAELGEGIGLPVETWIDTYGWIYDNNGTNPIPGPIPDPQPDYNDTDDNGADSSQ